MTLISGQDRILQGYHAISLIPDPATTHRADIVKPNSAAVEIDYTSKIIDAATTFRRVAAYCAIVPMKRAPGVKYATPRDGDIFTDRTLIEDKNCFSLQANPATFVGSRIPLDATLIQGQGTAVKNSSAIRRRAMLKRKTFHRGYYTRVNGHAPTHTLPIDCGYAVL